MGNMGSQRVIGKMGNLGVTAKPNRWRVKIGYKGKMGNLGVIAKLNCRRDKMGKVGKMGNLCKVGNLGVIAKLTFSLIEIEYQYQ